MKSLCDTCHKPGACCRAFAVLTTELGLPGPARSATISEVSAVMPDHPFKIKLISHGTPIWDCLALTKEGRCGIYERRPKLCRDFEAGVDQLCVMRKTDGT